MENLKLDNHQGCNSQIASLKECNSNSTYHWDFKKLFLSFWNITIHTIAEECNEAISLLCEKSCVASTSMII